MNGPVWGTVPTDADTDRRSRRPASIGSSDKPTHDTETARDDAEPAEPSRGSERLGQANRAAVQSLSDEPVELVVVPCPLQAVKLESIRIRVVGEDGRPLDQQKVELVNAPVSAGLCARTVTDAKGEAEFRGVRPGTYQISLYALDEEAWELLPEPGRQVTPGARDELHWQVAPSSNAPKPAPHEVRQGDCIASVAAKLGFSPETLWQASENADLRSRRESGYILFPGDIVRAPAKRRRHVEVRAGQSVQLRRKGIPEVLKIRFEDDAWRPRAGLTYLLEIETASAAAFENVTGTLNEDGLMIEPIPPDATAARVTLDPEGIPEIHEFALGHLDPITQISGVQARLNNLGFECGEVDGLCGEQTAAAIAAFEAAHGLAETRDPRDKIFVAKLQEAYVS